ncbi:hypothetical protein ACWGI1_34955, partial [Streptomyces sp. NPDC054835]
MTWRDRLRRHAAAPARGTAPTEPPATGPAAPRDAAAPDSGVPGNWDGGWRMTTSPRLTVSRAPLAVSDGLVFRDGLAAWQNPTFDTGLAHALTPTAPPGLVRGVTGPATTTPPAHSTGGPLLLRALSPYGTEPEAPSPEPTREPAPERTAPATGPGTVQRAATTGPGGASAAPEAPLTGAAASDA